MLEGTRGNNINYEYNISVNGDLLTSYHGSESLVYDNCGLPVMWFKHGPNVSPLSYILQWYDLRLTAVTDTDTGEMYYYKYNDQGIRTEKIVDGVVHKYYLQGDKIIAERIGDDLLTFYYDATGVCGFRYYNKGTDGNNSNGTDYYYLKNIFGDILGIYDDSGNVCAEYSYDAWGRCTIKGHASDFARMNPFRYRGYYYDRETGWYYLNSRYYDPEVGRFLSADTVEYLNPAAINGLNLYAYCMNNPVMFIDSSGLWPAPFIYRGYKIMFHPPRAGRGQQYHVHVDGKGKHFAQNIDGSPHDGLVGVPPKDVRDEIEKRTGGKWKWQVSNYVYSNYSFPNVLWTPYLSGNLPKMFIFPVNQFKISGNLWLPLQNEFSMNIIDPNPIGPDFSLPVFPYPNQGNTNGVIVGGGLIILILILLLIPGPQPI